MLQKYHLWRSHLRNVGLKSGRGVVICHIKEINSSSISSLQGELDEIINLQFVPKIRLKTYLNELILVPESIAHILQAVDSYNPQADLILLLQLGSQFEANILQNMAMTPPKCYIQVCQRWEEFQPDIEQS